MSDAVKQVGRDVRQVNTAAPVEVSIAAAAARSAQLTRGTYIITADVDCRFLQGDVTVVADDNDRKLWEKTYRWLYIHGNNATDDYVSVIRTTTDGTLSIEKIDNNPGVVGG
jgi:hypothetical protein